MTTATKPWGAEGAFAPKVELLDGKYRLERVVGEGGTGVVFEAVHVVLKRRCAVKVLRTAHSLSPDALVRFHREAEALGRLRHPNIVEVNDFGVDQARGQPYLVMEYLEGIALGECCGQRYVPFAEALPILGSIARAIDYAHAQGILHRDLKPGNVVLCQTPQGRVAKVLDFGLAQRLEPAATLGIDTLDAWQKVTREGTTAPEARLTAPGACLGTPYYASPEAIRGEVATPASDIYSFGALAHEFLTGRPPFEGTSGEVLEAHLSTPARVPEGLPAGVGEALATALEKDPLRRPRSACQYVAAIQKAAFRAWRVAQLPRRLALAALVALALFAGGLLFHSSALALSLENWLGDARLALVAARAPDPRILLLSVDDATPPADDGGLPAEDAPLAERADEFGDELGRVFEAGARGIAIDLLLPARWARSKPFSELVLRHPETITLAALSSEGGRVIGIDCLSPLVLTALGPAQASALFGFVNVDEDADGVTRRGRIAYLDRSGRERSSWAARVARAGGPPTPAADARFPIDFTSDWRGFERLSWREVASALDRSPQLFRGRLVLVGGDYVGSGDDHHRVPAKRGSEHAVSGLTLQALMVHTILNDFPLRDVAHAPALAACALVAWLCLSLLLCSHRRAAPLVVFGACAALYWLAASLAFASGGWMLPLATPLAVWSAALGVGLALRARLPRLADAGRLPS